MLLWSTVGQTWAPNPALAWQQSCNVDAEMGATTSVFPYNHRMKKYLSKTGRAGEPAGAVGWSAGREESRQLHLSLWGLNPGVSSLALGALKSP